jgi:hypothetical protein
MPIVLLDEDDALLRRGGRCADFWNISLTPAGSG